MAINKTNTEFLKESFLEELQIQPTVVNENQYGCDAIYIEIEDTINLDKLNRVVGKVGNTATIRAIDKGKIKFSVW
jgi:hypothetical protein